MIIVSHRPTNLVYGGFEIFDEIHIFLFIETAAALFQFLRVNLFKFDLHLFFTFVETQCFRK